MMKISEKIKKVYLNILKMLGLNENDLLYIAGSDKLPEPLDSEEEKELLEKLMKKDTEAKNILIERNLRLVVYIAKKFENS